MKIDIKLKGEFLKCELCMAKCKELERVKAQDKINDSPYFINICDKCHYRIEESMYCENYEDSDLKGGID